MSSTTTMTATSLYQGIESIQCDLRIHRAEDLAAKDRSLLNRRESSDPYVEVWMNLPTQQIGKTTTVRRTLEPTYDQSFQMKWNKKSMSRCLSSRHRAKIVLKVWDEDKLKADDVMGEVEIPLPLPDETLQISEQWVSIDPTSANHARGRLLVSLRVKYQKSDE
jgi:Ca2+-dependent lipid-binding protein